MPVMKLAAALDLAAAAPLQADLLAARGQDLEVDASAVQRLGGPCLQVLLAARLAWQADGRMLQVREPSGAFADVVAVMGAGPLLGMEG